MTIASLPSWNHRQHGAQRSSVVVLDCLGFLSTTCTGSACLTFRTYLTFSMTAGAWHVQFQRPERLQERQDSLTCSMRVTILRCAMQSSLTCAAGDEGVLSARNTRFERHALGTSSFWLSLHFALAFTAT